MQLQNSSGMSREQFEAARDRLLEVAQADPTLQQVRLSELPDVATLKVDVEPGADLARSASARPT